MFARKRKDSLAARALEEKLFDVIAAELREGVKKDGLWLKAVTQSGGNESLRESEYVKLRMQSLKDEMVISAEQALEQAAEQERADAEKQRAVDERQNAELAVRAKMTLAGSRDRGYTTFQDGADRWTVHRRFYPEAKLCRGIDELEAYLDNVIANFG